MKIKLSLIACIFTTISFASEVCKTDSDDMLSQLLLNHPSIKMSQEAVKGAQSVTIVADEGNVLFA